MIYWNPVGVEFKECNPADLICPKCGSKDVFAPLTVFNYDDILPREGSTVRAIFTCRDCVTRYGWIGKLGEDN